MNKLAVTKPGFNVQTDTDPSHFIYDSTYSTLKYYLTGTVSLTVPNSGSVLIASASATVAHSLGYIPFVEVYFLTPTSGQYEYCPSMNTGASTFWATSFTIDSTNLKLYGEQSNFSTPQIFTFKYFIFKNNTGL